MSPRDPALGPMTKSDSRGGAPPTDLELMLWVDGEIDPERADEIAELVKYDARARAIVFALRHGSQVLAADLARAAESDVADGIADNVMDTMEAEASRRLMAPVKRAPPWRAPAITAAGLAVFAAAAWMVIFSSSELRTPLASGTSTSGLPDAPFAAEPASATETAVSIDVVDFGARPGTIFYVPAEDESMLPVVWLTEDDTPSSGDGR